MAFPAWRLQHGRLYVTTRSARRRRQDYHGRYPERARHRCGKPGRKSGRFAGRPQPSVSLTRTRALQEYAVILLIPDLYTLPYVRDMSDLLLRQMGFKQLAVVQESICATFGAGLSSACVVDIGARTTKVACVEEGLVVPDTRMLLDFGGDDVTSFFFTLLSRINFPYKEADLSKWYDWIVLEDLKERIVVLSEVSPRLRHDRFGARVLTKMLQGDITLSLNDFFVRRPGISTQRYSLRVYDDCILAPYVSYLPVCRSDKYSLTRSTLRCRPSLPLESSTSTRSATKVKGLSAALTWRKTLTLEKSAT